MLNSLTSELDIMRPSLLESGLEVLNYNINRKQQDLKIYEIGNIYAQDGIGKYKQASKVGIWITGNVQQQHWEQAAKKADVFYLKGIVELILQLCGAHKYQLDITPEQIVYKRGKDILATIEQISNQKLKSFDIKQQVFYASIDVEILVQIAEQAKTQYKELPKFPNTKRDLAVVVDKSISYQQLIATVQKQKIDGLVNYDLFDIFESDKIGNDKKSLALSFTFQLTDKTLTDVEVDAKIQQIIQALEQGLQATIRS